MTPYLVSGQAPGEPGKSTATRPRRVCFLFTGQLHHVPHGLETALALAKMPGMTVAIRVTSEAHLDLIRPVIPKDGPAPDLAMIGSASLRMLGRVRGSSVPPKKLTLLHAREELNGYDAIVVPERTSTAARRLGITAPKLIHIDHGAGDRSAGYDPRIADFDFVLLAGDKQRERMIRQGLLKPGCFEIVGYPKFESADRIRPAIAYPFARRRPVLLYNPHFVSELSSWHRWGPDIIARIVETGRYNLIVAPHVRLFEGGRARRQALRLLEPCVGRPDIHIDLGSHRSIDMTYTELADVYLGDVSSQVYEFLRRPRPCVFLNPNGADWLGNEDYAHWRYGRVIGHPQMLLPALEAAHTDHQLFEHAQIRAFRQTFDVAAKPASLRAASAIARFCLRHA
ncbi:hypothetical protein [Sphingomonas sp.]|uniref:hypothetical protein n=1 Tax=Sphingomonas sp. TaxID=28214 RepID=UPI003B3B2606